MAKKSNQVVKNKPIVDASLKSELEIINRNKVVSSKEYAERCIREYQKELLNIDGLCDYEEDILEIYKRGFFELLKRYLKSVL